MQTPFTQLLLQHSEGFPFWQGQLAGPQHFPLPLPLQEPEQQSLLFVHATVTPSQQTP
jgi:hypothetical protein